VDCGAGRDAAGGGEDGAGVFLVGRGQVFGGVVVDVAGVELAIFLQHPRVLSLHLTHLTLRLLFIPTNISHGAYLRLLYRYVLLSALDRYADSDSLFGGVSAPDAGEEAEGALLQALLLNDVGGVVQDLVAEHDFLRGDGHLLSLNLTLVHLGDLATADLCISHPLVILV